jgi:hypothetical protein
MRYLYAGLLSCLCSSLAWGAVDDAPVKNKTQQHGHVQKLAKANAKAAPKLSAAELANLATQNEIAQRRAAFAASAAVVTTATVSTTATSTPTPPTRAAMPQVTAPAPVAVSPAPIAPTAPMATPPSAALVAPAVMPVAQTTATDNVHVGRMVCELGNAVSVTPDASRPGSYWVQMRQHRFHMTPVTTTTGAVRLEDAHAGAMWLQLPHKSMLMNSKLGQRMADECQSAHQLDVATRMKSGPPSTLLDGPSFAKK